MNFGEYFHFFWALLFVIGLIILIAIGVRRFGIGIPIPKNSKTTKKRISVLEVAPIDIKRKLILIKCDDNEHLLLLGANSETIIHSSIKKISSSKNHSKNLLNE